jgi:sterol desaturase/sphingolipid hydroxylase (fatty acid hydroxylase superfamily)
VLLFEIILNGAAMFNHSNLKLPLAFDRILRLLVVTPDMHRVHHSVVKRETDSNYGFNLSVWDRLFATYTDQPAAGHDGMTIGIAEWQDERPTGLWWTLSVPFLLQAVEKSRQKSPTGK